MTAVADKVSGRVVSRMFRNPGDKKGRPWLPIALTSPDFPVYKLDTDWLSDISINDGLHNQGIWLMPPCRFRLEGDLAGHFLNHKEKYLRSYPTLAKLDVRLIDQTPERAVDYMFKNLKRGRTSVDEIMVWPKSQSELSVSQRPTEMWGEMAIKPEKNLDYQVDQQVS